MEKGIAGEAPAEVETVVLKEPRVAEGEMVKVAVIWEELTTTTLETAMSGLEVATVAPATNLEPASVTGTEEPATPEEGLMEESVGEPSVTVNETGEEVPLALETVTFAAPREAVAPMAKEAVI